MSLQVDVSLTVLLRIDVPASLGDAEARAVAEAEALRRGRGLKGAVEAHVARPDAARRRAE